MRKTVKTPNLKKNDSKIYAFIEAEERQQAETLDLIASQNFASSAVREALTSVAMNRYSEGYPGKRYYPGNKNIDGFEQTAQERALKLFGLKDNEWGVNVQALSGAQANFAIYAALLEKEDIALGMRLAEGGHLSHGHKASLTGKFFNFIQYGLDEHGRINYSEVEKLAREHKPKIIIAGASAYSLEVDFAKFGRIAKKYNALLVADISHIAGLIVSGAHRSPFPYCDVVMTTTHKTLRGPRGALIFAKYNSAPGSANNTTVMEVINRSVFPGLQGGPHNNQIAAIAVALHEARSKKFHAYANAVVKNAKCLSEELIKLGYVIISGGTENHLMLVDLRNKKITGNEATIRLEAVGILANKNTVPGDTNPRDPSGIRFGTPMLTTRGMRLKEMREVARLVDAALTAQKEEERKKIRREVRDLAGKFPPPGFE